MLDTVGKTEKLELVDTIDLSVNINTEAWREVWEYTTHAYKTGTLYFQSDEQNNSVISLDEFINKDIFLSGKAAMTFQSPIYTSQLKHTNINWGIVTEPVSKLDYESSTHIYLQEIIAINNDTTNKDFAFAVLKYLNGPQLTHIKIRQLMGVPSRTLLEWNNQDLSAFYKLKPNLKQMTYDNLPIEFWNEVYNKRDELYARLIQGEIDIDLLIAELQTWTEITLQTFIDAGKITH